MSTPAIGHPSPHPAETHPSVTGAPLALDGRATQLGPDARGSAAALTGLGGPHTASSPHTVEAQRLGVDAVQRLGDRVSARFDPAAGITREYLQEALTTRIGKAVQDKLGAHGVDVLGAAGADVSAEATASRIFVFTTGLLGVFARQNPDLNPAELIDRFETTMRGAVNKGYQEAIAILDSMATFDAEVRALGQQTVDRLDSMYQDYFANLRAKVGSIPT